MNENKNRRSFLKIGVAVGTGLVLGGMNTKANGQDQDSDSMIFNVFKKRRSVRKFSPASVPEEHITKILDAAHLAPSGGNAQDWKFLVIRDRERLNQLKDACISKTVEMFKSRDNFEPDKLDEQRERAETYYEDYLSAPVYIIVLVDNRKGPEYTNRYNMKDGTLAAGYLMLAARALGYGTVFCTDSIPEEITQKVFNIPDYYNRICITPIGVPVEWPKIPNKKNLDELIVREIFQ